VNTINLIQELIRTRDQTLPFFDLSKEDLKKTYSLGKWDIKLILVHIADSESVFHERIKRIVSDSKQIIWGFDQDLWSSQLDYENFPISLSKELYHANRNSVIYFAEKYYANSDKIQFIHSESGLKCLKDIFDYFPFHNQTHLNQIQSALNSH